MRICNIEGCDKKHMARGLCATHYNQRDPKRHVKVAAFCGCCGTPVLKLKDNRRPVRFCSYACRDAYGVEHGLGMLGRPAKPKPVRAPRPEPKPKPAPSPPRDMRSPLRKALESGDPDAILLAIKADSIVCANGCWEWQRSRRKKGYPVMIIMGRNMLVHRLSLEAKHRKPLGKQAAHHMCANTACVNPDHLQPVTARENTAEMHARTYMESRIRDLEAALQAVTPDHPLLREIGVLTATA